MQTTRRTMIKLAVGSAGALLVAPLVLRSTRQLFAQSGGNRVVVVGGGWGGLSAARWLRRNRPQTEVILVEQNRIFMSCPLSNLFLGNVLPLESLQFSYAAAGRAGVEIVNERVVAIDRTSRSVETDRKSVV